SRRPCKGQPSRLAGSRERVAHRLYGAAIRGIQVETQQVGARFNGSHPKQKARPSARGRSAAPLSSWSMLGDEKKQPVFNSVCDEARVLTQWYPGKPFSPPPALRGGPLAALEAN
ncbi:hypothetical protein NHX12_009320, partial [Muraenolepis orangiensis]